MSEDDLVYLSRRARQEAELAQQSLNPAAGTVHGRLSKLYLKRIAAAHDRAGDGAVTPKL